ncbi:hypothetical protein M9H77_15337 [Catharanthus roseus]|uniref:Uncharacterized protein n=1 Tax=Catharanthus roseus TaxID=4058 RepID=A0ACC0AX74_CATRO|nr:hypothetical protein M9H77_15337 [Catharanthus roseus]
MEIDSILCDELIQEIFRRLPPSSFSAVCLVSRRWVRLFRSSTAALSLQLNNPIDLPRLFSFLSQHSFLFSLSISTTTPSATAAVSSDRLLNSIALSCPNLRELRFLNDPVSPFSLFSLSTSCPQLCSLSITLSRPVELNWVARLRFLKDLSIFITGSSLEFSSPEFNYNQLPEIYRAGLNLESLCLSGCRGSDYGLNWLWKNCNNLKKLKLKSCDGVGDNSSFSSFIKKCRGLQEVELRTCRTIIDGVLMKIAENSISLNSLLVYDGGSKEGLLQFISNNKCQLQKLDLRLPLDLDNDHLIAIGENFRFLSSLRLQSCCLVTGEGLKSLVRAMNDDNNLDELALINCDVIEREPGLLSTLGQNLKRLRKLDLSYNETLLDKELISILGSCNNLIELKLRGCRRLTNAATVCVSRSCKKLQILDLMFCSKIESEAIELFLLNSTDLKRLVIEQSKISAAAEILASNKSIEIVV